MEPHLRTTGLSASQDSKRATSSKRSRALWEESWRPGAQGRAQGSSACHHGGQSRDHAGEPTAAMEESEQRESDATGREEVGGELEIVDVGAGGRTERRPSSGHEGSSGHIGTQGAQEAPSGGDAQGRIEHGRIFFSS